MHAHTCAVTMPHTHTQLVTHRHCSHTHLCTLRVNYMQAYSHLFTQIHIYSHIFRVTPTQLRSYVLSHTLAHKSHTVVHTLSHALTHAHSSAHSHPPLPAPPPRPFPLQPQPLSWMFVLGKPRGCPAGQGRMYLSTGSSCGGLSPPWPHSSPRAWPA